MECLNKSNMTYCEGDIQHGSQYQQKFIEELDATKLESNGTGPPHTGTLKYASPAYNRPTAGTPPPKRVSYNQSDIDSQPATPLEHHRLHITNNNLASTTTKEQLYQNQYKKLHQAQVSFSDSSTMHVYLPDTLYERFKSHTKKECDNFSMQTLNDAVRIKNLVKSAPGSNMKDSVKYLLRNRIITSEEIVGIEHLALSNSMSKLIQERREHARAVLTEQRRQRFGAMLERSNHEETLMNKLGVVSASTSTKSVKRARARAAMAA